MKEKGSEVKHKYAGLSESAGLRGGIGDRHSVVLKEDTSDLEFMKGWRSDISGEPAEN